MNPLRTRSARLRAAPSGAGAAALAVTALVAVPAAPARAASTAPQLHVSGTKIVDSSGAVWTPHGVDRSGGEFSCVQGNGFWNGPMDQASVTASGPSLVSDYNGTPTNFGAGYKAHLATLSSGGGTDGGGTGTATLIRGVGSGKCLDASGYGTTNGTKVQIWDCTGGSNQQ